MIVRAGLAATLPVTFSSGQPDGDVTWMVLGPDGVAITSGVITPDPDAVSVNIPLSDVTNTLGAGEYISHRDATWSYLVNGVVQNGEERYAVHRRLPIGINPDNVRKLFGVSASELPDEEISLTESYLEFIDTVTQAGFDAALDGGINELRLRRAVEASAALKVLPSMPVRIANTESSGTNTFKRQEIDWAELGVALAGAISDGILVVIPTFSFVEGFGAIFMLASPATDPITGATR